MGLFILRIFRKIYKIFGGGKENAVPLSFDYLDQTASDFIKEKIESNNPLMAARFGNVEMHVAVPYFYRTRYNKVERILKYIKCEIGPFWWDKSARYSLSNNSGFFPVSDDKMLERFSQLILSDIQEIDILGSWTSI